MKSPGNHARGTKGNGSVRRLCYLASVRALVLMTYQRNMSVSPPAPYRSSTCLTTYSHTRSFAYR